MKRKFWFIAALVCLFTPVILCAACGDDNGDTPATSSATPDDTLTPSGGVLLPTWQKTFGTQAVEQAEALLKARDGGYVIVGNQSTQNIAKDISDLPITYLVKTDEEGNELWSRALGKSDGIQTAYSAVEAPDGGYIVAGSFAASDCFRCANLIKTDASGKEQWNKILEEDRGSTARAVSSTPDGGYIIAGSIYSKADNENVYLIRVDSEGNKLWSQTFGGENEDVANSVQQTTDGGYIVAGYTDFYGSKSSNDAYLIKTDSEGNELWSRTFGDPDNMEWLNMVQETFDGGYILVGYKEIARNADIYLIKTDSEGNELWSRTFGGSANDAARSGRQTQDGGYILAGVTYSNSHSLGNADVYLIRIDSEGNEIWQKTFGGLEKDSACEIELTSDGGYIIAGSTESYGAGLLDFYLIKTDAQGNCAPMPSSTPQ